ncbi:MAG: hypothetical protein ABI678_01315 [Kofleriaceae bacterium]
MRKLALAVLLVSGCSDGGSIDIDHLEGALVDRYCTVYVDCGIMEDLEQCRAYFAKSFHQDEDIIAAVKAGKVIYHADKAGACLDLIGGSCNRDEVIGSRTNGEACDEVYEGTVHADGACALDAECISQDCNTPSCAEACCQGTCVGDAKPAPRGQVGATCNSDSDCHSSFCDPSALKCTAFLADGAACTSSSQCESYSCNGNSQVCETLVAEGAACTSSAQCRDIADNCNSSHVCSRGVEAGVACTTSSDCKALDRCDTATHVCAERPVLGDTCTGTYDCLDSSWCDSTNTCVAPQADGTACTDDQECTSRNCDATSNTCTTPAVCI